MGSINQRKRKDGTTGWLAQVSIWRDGKHAHRESRTFERRSLAASWIEKREEVLSKPGALEDLPKGAQRHKNVTLGDAIDKYVEDSAEKRAKVGDALRGGMSWRCSRAVNSLPRKRYATCDQGCAAFIALRDQLEQQFGAGFAPLLISTEK